MVRGVTGYGLSGITSEAWAPVYRLPSLSPLPSACQSDFTEYTRHYRIAWSPGGIPQGGRIVKDHTTTPSPAREACARTSGNNGTITYLLTYYVDSEMASKECEPTKLYIGLEYSY